MECETVFTELTRGPFPSGRASDKDVEAHLRICPSCQQLAHALVPALDVFEESLTAAEGRELPGYRGALAPPVYATVPLPPVATLATQRTPTSIDLSPLAWAAVGHP